LHFREVDCMTSLRIALIGCGKISHKYAGLIAAHADEAHLVAVCDLDATRSADFGAKYGAAAFDSIDAMMDALGATIDVYAVLTPSGAHAANVCLLAENGARNILVEKPIALTIEDAEQAIHVCERTGARLFIVKQWRYSRAAQALRQAYDQGRFGKISLLTTRLRWCRHQQYYDEARWRGTWAQDGGVLTNQAVHAIDLLVWFGGEVQSVYALCQTTLANIEAEDTAVAVLRFTNGRLGAIEATTAVRPKNLEASFSIIGEGGAVELGGGSVNAIQEWQFERPEPQDDAIRADIQGGDASDSAHWAYLKDVFACIREGRDGGVSGREALRSLRVIHALYQSDQLNMPVDVASSSFPYSRLGRKALQPESAIA
jgi:UDP-N-acetyl-2-amino-2-deoxyglucuronate dehydrogenase